MLDHADCLEVLLDDLVDIGAVDIGVPDRLRVHHDAGPFLAAIQAPRLIHPHLTRTCEAQFLDPFFCVVAHSACAFVVAAGLAVLALVAAEKNVSFVVAHFDRNVKAYGQLYCEESASPGALPTLSPVRRRRAEPDK